MENPPTRRRILEEKEKEVESKLRKMDSSIKKNAALVKKLKTLAITETTSGSLKTDLNQDKRRQAHGSLHHRSRKENGKGSDAF